MKTSESSWWSSQVKPRFHRPGARHVAWKVQDAFNGGLPDVDFCFDSVAGKVELKFDTAWPKRANTETWFSYLDKQTKAKAIVSATQNNHLQQWHNAGGLSFVLIGVGYDWLLLRQGEYENRPQTQAELIEAAVLRYMHIGGSRGAYDSLLDIPPFIVETYGQAGRDIVCIP